MNQLSYDFVEGALNLSQLQDEIMLAMPTLAPVALADFKTPVGRPATTTPMRMQGTAKRAVMLVPDDTDEAAIQGVVDAHVPAPPEVVKTVDEIEAILGSNPGKQRRALAELLGERPDIVKNAGL